jgi:uncharacterized protein with PQ loop repeat
MYLEITEKIAFCAAIILPLFNIPLIMKIIKRKSSADLSLCWVLGVWICILLMAPSGFRSEDTIWRTFNYANVVLFSAVAVVTLRYRKGSK